MENTLKFITLAFTFSLLAACGGSDNGEPNTTTPPTTTTPPEPTLVMPVGVWSGLVTVTENNEEIEIVGLVAGDGTFNFIRDDEQQYSGLITLTDETSYTATATGFGGDNLKLGNGEFKGDYSASSITGQTIFDGEVISTFALTPLDITQAGSGLSVIAGNYVDADLTTSIMLDDSGALSGSDTFGCQYTGTVEHKDVDINLYSLKLTVSSCADLDGEYSGLATYGKVYDDVPAGLIFQGSNANYSLTNILFRD